MKKRDLLLEDFKKASQKVENVNSLRGGQRINKKTTDTCGTMTAHTDGDVGNCDCDSKSRRDTGVSSPVTPGGIGG